MCLCVVLFGLILFGTLCFLDLDVCFLSKISEIFSYYFFQISSLPLSLLLGLWDSYNVNVSTFGGVQKVS